MTTTTRTNRLICFAGQVVIAYDMHHEGRRRRPHLIYEVDGDWAYVAELTHTPQGEWATDELGGGTFLALWDFRTREWMPRWVHTSTLDRYGVQLTDRTREAALDAIAKGLA